MDFGRRRTLSFRMALEGDDGSNTINHNWNIAKMTNNRMAQIAAHCTLSGEIGLIEYTANANPNNVKQFMSLGCKSSNQTQLICIFSPLSIAAASLNKANIPTIENIIAIINMKRETPQPCIACILGMAESTTPKKAPINAERKANKADTSVLICFFLESFLFISHSPSKPSSISGPTENRTQIFRLPAEHSTTEPWALLPREKVFI